MAKNVIPNDMEIEFNHINYGRDFEIVGWTRLNEYRYTPPAPTFFYWRNNIIHEDRPLPTEEMWQQFLTCIEEIWEGTGVGHVAGVGWSNEG